ncbi:hypothetical protein ACN6KF_003023 [Labrys sp. La1]|uniref:hypothetical protein n=1 Tax=Labrys sp. La1 TaxID=3404917 RepID=UPI003EBEFC7E
MRRDPIPKGFIPDDPGPDRADFDYDDMSMGTARAFVFILAALGIVFCGLIIGFAIWLKS